MLLFSVALCAFSVSKDTEAEEDGCRLPKQEGSVCFYIFEKLTMHAWLAWNSLCAPGWP